MRNLFRSLGMQALFIEKAARLFYKLELRKRNHSSFPYEKNGSSMLRKKIYQNRSDGEYFINVYKSRFFSNIAGILNNLIRVEMLQGKYIDGEITIDKKPHDIVAISSTLNLRQQLIQIRSDGKDNAIQKQLDWRRFHYLNMPSSANLTIQSKYPFFISHFKYKYDAKLPKLILNIFIDGLTSTVLKEKGLDILMPNTHSFFHYTNLSCYATGDWSAPSMASIFTGKWTSNHKLSYPSETNLETANKLMQEYLFDEGFMTAMINANGHMSPNYGYYKKTNRTIFGVSGDRMLADEILGETLEHLEIFKEYNNFLWISFMDLHACEHSTDVPLRSIHEEKLLSDQEQEQAKSVFRAYDPNKIMSYISEMKRTDFYLGILYDYIQKNYSDQEIIVLLYSDHGQSYLAKDTRLVSDCRVNIPFMMRGRGVPQKTDESLMSVVDIMPTLLSLLNIKPEQPIDGEDIFKKGERRRFVISEARYPGQTYKACIRDQENEFYFETKGAVGTKGEIDSREYTTELKSRQSGEAITSKEEIDRYVNQALKHIGHFEQAGKAGI